MDELWRTLRIGDRVRIAHTPLKFASAPEPYRLDPETEELYRHLATEAAVLTVTETDDWGVPWIDYLWVRSNGTEEHHSLGLNHDGLERVT